MVPRLAGGRARPTAVLLATALILLSGCGDPVEITEHDLSDRGAAACEAFTDALPGTLAEQERVEVASGGGHGAAYGDPPIVVTCGVPEPRGFGPGAACEVANDVRWYLPDDQFGDEPQDLTLTSAWRRPRVQVQVPSDYWPEGGAAVMAALARQVNEHLRRQPGECL